MYVLFDRKGLVRMRNGQPFTYSDMRMARLGQKILQARRRRKMDIRPA